MKASSLQLIAQEKVTGPKGIYTLQASVLQCTRCNACVQSCPAYLCKPQELFSPRGRVQTLRLLTENKFTFAQCEPYLKELSASCMYCAQCSAACAGQLPIALYMRAVERTLNLKRLPASLRMCLGIYHTYPACFDKLMRFLLILRRFKILTLLTPVLPKWLRHANKILPAQSIPLRRILKQNGFNAAPEKPNLLYLPSLYAQYADAQTGWQTLQLVSAKKPYVLFGISSGLSEYLYGPLSKAQQAAKRLLVQWEKSAAGRTLPLLTDSIEIYAFLKNYPLLFAALPGWQQRAQKFADQVIYISDLPVKKREELSGKTVAPETSCALFPVKNIAAAVQKILLTDRRSNLLEFEYSRFPLPTAGLAFARHPQTEELVRRHVQDLTRQQIAEVYCLSGWAALELQTAARSLYPSLKAQHLIYGIKGYGRSQKRERTTLGRRKTKSAD